MASQSGPDGIGFMPPPRPRQVELRALIGVSRVNGATARRQPGHIICAHRSFWLLAPGVAPRRIVHTDPRKERKF